MNIAGYAFIGVGAVCVLVGLAMAWRLHRKQVPFDAPKTSGPAGFLSAVTEFLKALTALKDLQPWLATTIIGLLLMCVGAAILVWDGTAGREPVPVPPGDTRKSEPRGTGR